jgi:hypothetical protein
VLRPDGGEWHAAEGAGVPGDAARIGGAAGANLLKRAPRAFLAAAGIG